MRFAAAVIGLALAVTVLGVPRRAPPADHLAERGQRGIQGLQGRRRGDGIHGRDVSAGLSLRCRKGDLRSFCALI